MWQYYLLGRLMGQERMREAANDRRATEARRERRRASGTSRFELLNLRHRHHES